MTAEKIPVSRSFQGRIVSCNGLDREGFARWLFRPGMLFGSNARWWGRGEKRDRPHEGTDLCLYTVGKGEVRCLDHRIMVPVVFEGQIVSICDDFLGQSLFIRHEAYASNDAHLYTIYGHVSPPGSSRPGTMLAEGDIVGTIADAVKKNGAIPSHLHVSVAWIPDAVPARELDWDVIHKSDGVVFLDPLEVAGCSYSIIDG